ncbi:uncharacterized protein LOC115821880 [Chanos chanos]|uniref:Uncharacterized protein LOC115821880 n=1 Tax=Chanos chanos TaxID=29144 RepID=A0A6J2WCD1_CHACN|nr:uncharacterized protein LOC115821880 [Chanos chanos]
MASELVKKTQGITTAKDMRESTKIIMKPYANWEEYLTPAPLSIAIMGELVYISSTTDFSINKNAPKDGYKYIRYPESFRACLMQVCNSGWGAFNEAHKSMDQIRLHTSTVPDYMETAVKTLFQGSDEVIQALLPDQLENIRVIADDCVELASAAEQKFTDVINIIQELLEACVNAEHFYGEELNEIKKRLEEAKMREQTSQEANERSKKAMKRMEDELEDAQEKYSKAMDSLPSGWEVIGMNLVEGITESVTSLVNGLTSIVTIPVSLMCQALGTVKNACDCVSGEDDAADEVDKINIYSKSGEILRATEILGKFIEGEDIEWKKLYDQKKKYTNTDFVADQFKRLQSDLQRSPDCEPKQEAIHLCETGINICQQLAKYAPEGQCSLDETKKIISNWKELIKSARAFDSKSKSVTKSPSMTPKPPMMYQQENKSEGSGKMSAGERASANAHFRIEQTRAQLDKTREMYEKCVENMEKNQKELTDILVTMRNCEIKEIDFNTIIEMLVKGMDAMGKVKEQWEKMVHFFQMVSNIVKVSLSKTLHNFVTTSEKTQKLSYNGKLFSKDMLYNQAFQASNIASLVHMISETYTEVSTKYLMDRVSSLGKLMAMDKSKPEFEQEHQQLQNGCDEAQRGILHLVIKNKKDFEKSADARLEKIEGELLAILPAAAPDETKAIKEAVQAGMNEEEEASYY